MSQEEKDAAALGTSETLNELKKTIEKSNEEVKALRQELADGATELEEIHKAAQDEISAKDAELEVLKAKVEELTKGLEELRVAKEEADSKLKAIEEQVILTERIQRLKSAKVLLGDETKQYEQAKKVMAMTDAEFNGYMEELVAVYALAKQEFSETVSVTEQPTNETAEDIVDAIADAVSESAATEAEVDDRVLKALKSLSVSKPASTAAEGTKDAEEGEEQNASTPGKESASLANPSVSLLIAGFRGILQREDIN